MNDMELTIKKLMYDKHLNEADRVRFYNADLEAEGEKLGKMLGIEWTPLEVGRIVDAMYSGGMLKRLGIRARAYGFKKSFPADAIMKYPDRVYKRNADADEKFGNVLTDYIAKCSRFRWITRNVSPLGTIEFSEDTMTFLGDDYIKYMNRYKQIGERYDEAFLKAKVNGADMAVHMRIYEKENENRTRLHAMRVPQRLQKLGVKVFQHPRGSEKIGIFDVWRAPGWHRHLKEELRKHTAQEMERYTGIDASRIAYLSKYPSVSPKYEEAAVLDSWHSRMSNHSFLQKSRYVVTAVTQHFPEIRPKNGDETHPHMNFRAIILRDWDSLYEWVDHYIRGLVSSRTDNYVFTEQLQLEKEQLECKKALAGMAVPEEQQIHAQRLASI